MVYGAAAWVVCVGQLRVDEARRRSGFQDVTVELCSETNVSWQYDSGNDGRP